MTLPTTIVGKLEQARLDLLDLTTRNRLLSTSRTQARSGRLGLDHGGIIVGAMPDVFEFFNRHSNPAAK